ncbi:hypothetical protein, partial [Brevibacterium litoralis]|uniref:hypothetical protein n=1 Tax=Brevibacterium litoralis TaxID=3138935 RepID=UPI0032EDE08A
MTRMNPRTLLAPAVALAFTATMPGPVLATTTPAPEAPATSTTAPTEPAPEGTSATENADVLPATTPPYNDGTMSAEPSSLTEEDLADGVPFHVSAEGLAAPGIGHRYSVHRVGEQPDPDFAEPFAANEDGTWWEEIPVYAFGGSEGDASDLSGDWELAIYPDDDAMDEVLASTIVSIVDSDGDDFTNTPPDSAATPSEDAYLFLPERTITDDSAQGGGDVSNGGAGSGDGDSALPRTGTTLTALTGGAVLL